MKKIICILILALSITPAYGKISEEIVERAWDRVTKAADFKRLPINYEPDDTPNAWVKYASATNYSVHVTTGLMDLLQEEDDIAGVLGHEIGHVKLGHYGGKMTRFLGYTILGAVLAQKDDDLASLGGLFGMSLIEGGFSRGQEVAADDYGTKLLLKAGYSPFGLYNAMVEFWNNGIITRPSGFNSHPPTERRIKHIYEYASKLQKSN